ncbi:MAG: ATP-binding protein [Candidatus Promineifilaceae bacterium]
MTEQPKQQQIDTCLAHAWQICRKDAAAAFRISKENLQQAIYLDYDRGRALGLRNLARGYLDQNETERALEYAQESIAIFEALRDLEGLAQVLNVVAEAYWELGDYSQTLSHNLRTLQLAQQTRSRKMEAHALANLAQVYVKLQQYDKAREMLTLAMPIFAEVGEAPGVFHALNNMAMLSLVQQEYVEAEAYAKRALVISKTHQWRLFSTIAYDTLGQILSAVEREAEAEAAYRSSLEINAGEFKRNVCITNLSLARLCSHSGKLSEAFTVGRAALEIGQALKNRQLQSEAHQVLAEVCEAMNDPCSALEHLKQHHALHQEVHNQQSERALVNMEVRYRTTAARKEAQILRQTNAELQHEIAERVRIEAELVEAKNSAEKAKFAAESASRAKSEFLSNMSHELRTPLNGILGYAQILARSNALDPPQLEGVEIIQHSGEHLLTLINDILDISKIEARRLELQECELHLSSFLEGIVGLMKMRAEQQGIDLIFEVIGTLPNGILIDEKRLRQVLINLLGNAIKFTERGSVTLRIHSLLDTHDQAQLRFEAIDTGIGIAPEHCREIFQPFEQVGNSQQRAAGTGLGLAISQRLVEAMGGEIQVESSLGEGSRFWFEIVVRTATSNPEVRPFLPPVIGFQGIPQSILIVDDTPYNCLLLHSLLAPLGFELYEAVNGAEALALAADYKPDLILLDLVLPDCNGLDIVEDLRRHAPQTTIVAVSASIIDLSREMIVNAGCDDFLPKPIRVDDLFLLIPQFLDIEWVYEERAVIREPNKFDSAVDEVPSAEQLQTLLDLAGIGDLHGVERMAHQLQEETSALQPFTHHVIQFAHEFDEESLTKLLQECLDSVQQFAALFAPAR